MGHSLTQERLEDVWVCLADVFGFYLSETLLDKEEERENIISKVSDIDITMLKKIFFYDVAPEYASYASPSMVFAYYDHYGFDAADVVKTIKKKKEIIVHSKVRLLLHEIQVKYLQWRLKKMWNEFEDALIEYHRRTDK